MFSTFPSFISTTSSAIFKILSWWDITIVVPLIIFLMSSNISVNLLKLQRSIPASGSSNTVSDEFLAITDAISILFSSPPVKVEDVETHKMHSEYFKISKEVCDIINKTKEKGKKVISVGTTTCRVLESASKDDRKIYPASGETSIFIYPGYKFKIIDSLITNFHLPESTLIMLVSALAGKENIMGAYTHAVEEKYRFFSFGDAMFITDIK